MQSASTLYIAADQPTITVVGATVPGSQHPGLPRTVFATPAQPMVLQNAGGAAHQQVSAVSLPAQTVQLVKAEVASVELLSQQQEQSLVKGEPPQSGPPQQQPDGETTLEAAKSEPQAVDTTLVKQELIASAAAVTPVPVAAQVWETESLPI